jgi:hypothetical protein
MSDVKLSPSLRGTKQSLHDGSAAWLVLRRDCFATARNDGYAHYQM